MGEGIQAGQRRTCAVASQRELVSLDESGGVFPGGPTPHLAQQGEREGFGVPGCEGLQG